MLLSLRWLQEFVDLSVPVKELAQKLTMSGFEVESIEEIGPRWDNIIVAEVLEHSPHPNAEKLTINSVYTGHETLQIVCGAPNVQAGQKVALATIGAAFPSGLIIKRSKIRGQISEGMICSAEELGLGDADGGILVLDTALEVGKNLADALDLRDTILDIGLTPNRSDCLSVIGMAREIAALLELPLRIPAYTLPGNGPSTADKITLEIEAPELCPRYCAAYAEQIRIEPSPLWMRQRLENCGIRAINNIVDITNYVLLEWGQPLHAFDYQSLQEATIIVRQADNAESFTTLDGTAHTLPQGALMICDGGKPRALAGIMGGLDSSITANTKAVLLESAYFNPASIARTGRSLGITTEASQRFEKGVDPCATLTALERAAALIVELKAGSAASELLDTCPVPLPHSHTIAVSPGTVNKKLGLLLDAESITRYLTRLSMSVAPGGPDSIQVTPPPHRYDINTQVDVIEEIARMHGYDNIPITYPRVSLTGTVQNRTRKVALEARNLLISSGFSEVINYSFQDPEVLASLRFKPDDERSNPVRLLNPLSASQSIMRTSILGSLLQNLQHNLHTSRCSHLALFEISNVFLKTASGIIDEKRLVSGLLYGTRNTATWALPNRSVDIFDIKGTIEILLKGLNVDIYRFESGSDEPYLSPQTGIRVYIANQYCGVCGILHPDIADFFGADGSVLVFELDFNQICTYYSEQRSYKPFSRFPAVQRDLALVINQNVTAAEISTSIAEFKNKIITHWEIFDIYQGKSITVGKKSIAYRLTFQSNERTLTDSEVNKVHDKLLAHLRVRHDVELR